MAELTIDMLLYAYAHGIFPMADGRNGEVHWYSADPRAIIPLETYHPQRSLRPILNKNVFEIRINTSFKEVMRHCAAPRTTDPNTWISQEMIDVYTQLHQNGYAHSVEAWYDGQLAGGLYGIALGGAFFGESMFTLRSNASKVAFHYLIQRLITQGFKLLDTQFINDNVLRYGAIEIPSTEYHQQLEIALAQSVSFL